MSEHENPEAERLRRSTSTRFKCTLLKLQLLADEAAEICRRLTAHLEASRRAKPNHGR